MARKYTGALSLANAATIDYNGPWDNRSVQLDYAALKETATWLSGGGYRVYPGMMVTLVTGEAYVYIGAVASTEFTSDDKWVKIGSGGSIDPDAKIFQYIESVASLAELLNAIQVNGAKVGHVYDIYSSFTIGTKTYEGGTNVVFKQEVAKGTTEISDWSTVIDPLTGDFVTRAYLQQNYYTKSDVNGLLPSADEKLNATQRAKLDLINSDGADFTTDLLTIEHGSTSAQQTSALWTILGKFYNNGQLNFLKAGGYKVKVDVESKSDTAIVFCFMVKGEHYRGTITKSGNTYTMSWAFYDSTSLLPVGVNYTDLYTTQAAFTAVAQQNKTLVENALTQIAGYGTRITAVENKLKWYDLDS